MDISLATWVTPASSWTHTKTHSITTGWKRISSFDETFRIVRHTIHKTSFANFKPKRSCKFTPIFCALTRLQLMENLKPTLEEVREHISKLPDGDKVVDGVSLEDLALFLDNRIEMPAHTSLAHTHQ